VSSGHRFELFLVKREEATYIIGPFWISYCRSHNIALYDVVTFTLIKQEARAGDDEDEEGSAEENVLQDEILNRAEHVFK
jgi:hypothetical protein